MSQERIVFIPGILTSPELQKFQWGKAAREMFPDREIIVIEKTYVYNQHNTLDAICSEVITLVSDGVPTILVGHSFGGILATAVYWQTQHMPEVQINKLVTIFSPHTYNAPGLEKARKHVGYQYKTITDIPVCTFGARIDHVVPKKYTHYPNATHMNLLCSHSGVWLAPRSWKYRHIWNALR